MRIRLTLDKLATMDQGKLALAFERELLRISEDLMDRPGDKTKRKLDLRGA